MNTEFVLAKAQKPSAKYLPKSIKLLENVDFLTTD